jgi:hypothetical protein
MALPAAFCAYLREKKREEKERKELMRDYGRGLVGSYENLSILYQSASLINICLHGSEKRAQSDQ